MAECDGAPQVPYNDYHLILESVYDWAIGMAQVGPYSKPPLTEALLDIQVGLPEDTSVKLLETCHDEVRAQYPTKLLMKAGFARLEAGEHLTATTSEKPIGHRFLTDDGLQIFQARTDGFTHNRLAPYLGWELFRTEARRLWDVYRGIVRPVTVKRIAVRYINRFDLPSASVDLKEYLRTGPEISSDLPQGMVGFFFQVTLALTDISAMVNLTETVVESPLPDGVSLVFDIDLYRTEDLPSDDAGLWRLLEDFREKKDAVFEACITEKTREMIR